MKIFTGIKRYTRTKEDKKQVLLLTTLLPSSERDMVTSRALFNVIHYWQELSLFAIKIYTFSPFHPSTRVLPGKSIIDGISIQRIPIFHFPKTTSWNIFALRVYLSLLHYTPDLILAHLYPSTVWCIKLLRLYNCPLVLGIHGSDTIKIRRNAQKAIRAASLIVFRSKSIESRFVSLYGRPKCETMILPSGINKDDVESTEVFELKARKPEGKFKFIVAAKLQALKHIDVSIRALSNMKDRDWEFTIIGDGSERKSLESLVEANGLFERVRFLGQLDRAVVLQGMLSSNIFVMVSAPETFGLVYLEAMAKACIVVGARGWGIDGIVEHGVNGFLCEPGDEAGLREVLLSIMDMDAESYRAIIHRSAETVAALDERHLAEKYQAKLIEIAEKHRKNNI